jgi:hypothetical protein
MKRFTIALVFLLLSTGLRAQSPATKAHVLEEIARSNVGTNFAEVAAKIRLGIDTDLAYRQLDTLLARPYGDMFWMYGCAGLYWSTIKVLHPEYKERIRWCWKHFTPYRGDTENHFLMYYGSLYLMSQAWPGLQDTDWFMGMASDDIRDASKEYLNHWIDETVRTGQEEFNSPRYDYYYITPLALLAQYTFDPQMKKRFTMMLEFWLADYAVEYLNGSYCGAHARVSDQAAIDPRAGEVTSYGQYFFEDSVTRLEPDLAFAALTDFTCPDVIRMITKDRDKPFENREFKRGRTTIRNAPFKNAVVRKYDYMTKDYCLGSMQGGLVQPIQQQSWSLVFAGQQPNNILFGLHPNYSADELAEFFPEEPSYLLEKIGSTKAGYPNENKWVGGSPYERIYQNKNMLVALYDIPQRAKYHHVDLFIPQHAVILAIDSGTHKEGLFSKAAPGWTVLQYDSTLVGILLFTPYHVTSDSVSYRIRTKDGRTGYWVVCKSMRDVSVMEFEKSLSSMTMKAEGDSVAFLNAEVESIRCKLKDSVDYQPSGTMLFASPYLSAPLGGEPGDAVITIKDGTHIRVLDFKKNREN